MTGPTQIGTTPEGYEIWDNGKQSMWAICRKHDWALLEAYGYSGFNTDEKCVGCLIEQRIIKLLEEFLGYGDEDWDADVMACIALIKGEQK